jgi:putative CocE/NonD family hydrolase
LRTTLPVTLSVALTGLAITALPQQQPGDEVRATYTKHEYYVPMRDGIRLFTAIYVPKERAQPYPIMLLRTPYSVGPYGVDQYRTALGPSEHFMKERFIFVYQDVRGRFMSEGDFVEIRPHDPDKKSRTEVDESTDTYDTIEWLLQNVPGHNGKVGMWGISYPGFYVAAGMIDAHPALKAASPQAPIGDTFMGDDTAHNGAFFLAANFGFYRFFAERKGAPAPPPVPFVPAFEYDTPDHYDFFLRMGPLANSLVHQKDSPYWRALLDHMTYDDFWRSRAIVNHLRGIKPAVMNVGGWFDAEDLYGPLAVYRAVERTSPASANVLVMGPWTHGSWSGGDGDRVGNLSFASKTGAFYREHIELPFFLQHLKGKAAAIPEAYMFHTGINEWRQHEAWPPRAASLKPLYLSPAGGLSWDKPAESQAAADEYVSDPARPVPYLGYTAVGMRGDYMSEDQRFAAQRPDVLVYRTEPLEGDLSLAGPIEVELHVATSGTDSDFVIKLIDVYPNDFPQPSPAPSPSPAPAPPANAVRMGGYQQLVRGEPFRGRFRQSFEKPVAFEPGQPDLIRFTMPDVAHTFRRGHRVMIQVQSSWFPLVDRNPQTFVDIAKARPEDFQKATQRVYRSADRPSSLGLWVLSEAGPLTPAAR